MTDTDDDAPGPKDDRPHGSSRGWKIAAVVAVLAAVGSLGALGYLLFAGGEAKPKGDVKACIIDPASRDFTKQGDRDGHSRPANCPPKGAKQMDGLVDKTSEGGFSIREIVDGARIGDTIELHVREPDRPYIDIAHAQTHAALGQPIRVYTLEIDGRESVVYMEDAPLLR